jgi:hypothetical protein
MNLDAYLDRFRQQAATIAHLVENVDEAQARWKPTPDQWSILEVVNHLYDEEVEDFRIRLKLTLQDPQAEWPPNDPVGKVTARNYNSREITSSLQNFLDERTLSMEWLSQLDTPDWSLEHQIPDIGTLAAGDLLVSWVAHDLLHIRQLMELHFQYQRQLAQPYRVDYAGDY